MDLLEFEGQKLYFDQPLSADVEELLQQAAERYGEPDGELKLLQAYLYAPDHLTVLVALYRYYYYQHRLEDAMVIAGRALKVSGELLGFPDDWNRLSIPYVGAGAMISMGLVRFYLMALKAAGYLNLRMGNIDDGVVMLDKVVALDSSDRLGAAALLDLARAQRGNAEERVAM